MDLVNDLVDLDITEITIRDVIGLNLIFVDTLKEKGIKVNILKNGGG